MQNAQEEVKNVLVIMETYDLKDFIVLTVVMLSLVILALAITILYDQKKKTRLTRLRDMIDVCHEQFLDNA